MDDMFAPLGPQEGLGATAAVDTTRFLPLAPPAALEKGEIRHPTLGSPSHVWRYCDGSGRLEGYVCRFETDGGNGKEFRPYRYGEVTKKGRVRVGWHWKGWGEGRPLYNVCELQRRPDARVIVIEGEKTTDAAKSIFPACVVVSPMNGARSPHKSDWSVLRERDVVVWPDNDTPGREFGAKVAGLATAAGATKVAIVTVPQNWPESWDLADALPDGVAADEPGCLLTSATWWTASPAGLPKAPASEEEIAAEVLRLAGVSGIKYQLERKAVAAKLGIGVKVLDDLVKRERGGGEAAVKPGQGRPVGIAEVEPWPVPVAGASLLEEIARAIRGYVVLSPRQADAVAVWVLFTHTFDAFDFSPKLVVNSPEKRSGKTRLVEVLERLTRHPLFISGISPAALLRVIEQHAPSMLIDEIDTLMRGDAEMAEALRGLINCGFSRAGARMIKTARLPDGGFEPREFSTWCPMMLSGIGKLPDTVADRSIMIAMVRKRPDEKVKRLRSCDGAELHDLARKAARWATDNLDVIKLADPRAPEELHDRAADAWSPLFAIADVAGGEWPDRARRAAIELTGGGESAETVREMLLADLYGAFAGEPSGVLFTKEILAKLLERDDRPWSEWKGKPITARQVAALLRPLGVPTNNTVHRGDEHGKGYQRAMFEDVFCRYLRLPPHQSVLSVQSRRKPQIPMNFLRCGTGLTAPIKTRGT